LLTKSSAFVQANPISLPQPSFTSVIRPVPFHHFRSPFKFRFLALSDLQKIRRTFALHFRIGRYHRSSRVCRGYASPVRKALAQKQKGIRLLARNSWRSYGPIRRFGPSLRRFWNGRARDPFRFWRLRRRNFFSAVAVKRGAGLPFDERGRQVEGGKQEPMNLPRAKKSNAPGGALERVWWAMRVCLGLQWINALYSLMSRIAAGFEVSIASMGESTLRRKSRSFEAARSGFRAPKEQHVGF
jgi:hypothetical protein